MKIRTKKSGSDGRVWDFHWGWSGPLDIAMDELALGIAIGVGVGISLGAALEACRDEKDDM